MKIDSSSRARRGVAVLGMALTAVILTGCTQEVPTPVAAPLEANIPAVTEDQAITIAEAVATVIGTADKEKDSSALKERVTGPALKLRSAEYKISDSQKDEKSITELPSVMQSTFLTTATTWPRTMFAVSERPQNLEPERLMVYTQDDARSDYKLWSYLTLFPGTTVPTFAAATIGTTAVTDSDESLQMTPTKALEEYAGLLAEASKENKAKFDVEKDSFYTTIESRRKDLKSAAKQIEGSYKETFKVDKDWQALRTTDGGALVVGTIETTGSLKGEKGAVVTPSSLEKAFLKSGEKASNALTVKRTAVVAIYIPNKDNEDEKPRNIGRLLRTTGASIP